MNTLKILAAVLALSGAVQVQAAPPAPSPSSVVVVNSPSQPVPVIMPVVEPFQHKLDMCFLEGAVNAQSNTVTVLSGKRLAIQYVSAEGNMPSGQKLLVTVNVFSSPSSFLFGHSLPVSLLGTFNSDEDLFAGGEPMSLYADAGNLIQAAARRSGGPAPTGDGCVSVYISGYLTNSP